MGVAMTNLIYTDVVVEFDPVEYGPVIEGQQTSISFRIVARAPPARQITILFSTRSQTALGMCERILTKRLPFYVFFE